MTIVEFLLARLAEDEAVAQNAAAREPNFPHFGDTAIEAAAELSYSEGESSEAYNFILHMHPARVLSECEAKRRIVTLAAKATDEHESLSAEFIGTKNYDPNDDPDPGEAILRALALPYADHPDYRDEWRVDPAG